MSRNSHKQEKKSIARMAWLVLFVIIGLVAAIDKDNLPAGLQQNDVVIDLYAKREKVIAMFTPATTEKKTEKTLLERATEEKQKPEAPGKGYSDKDRSNLDHLISNGSKDP